MVQTYETEQVREELERVLEDARDAIDRIERSFEMNTYEQGVVGLLNRFVQNGEQYLENVEQ